MSHIVFMIDVRLIHAFLIYCITFLKTTLLFSLNTCLKFNCCELTLPFAWVT